VVSRGGCTRGGLRVVRFREDGEMRTSFASSLSRAYFMSASAASWTLPRCAGRLGSSFAMLALGERVMEPVDPESDSRGVVTAIGRRLTTCSGSPPRVENAASRAGVGRSRRLTGIARVRTSARSSLRIQANSDAVNPRSLLWEFENSDSGSRPDHNAVLFCSTPGSGSRQTGARIAEGQPRVGMPSTDTTASTSHFEILPAGLPPAGSRASVPASAKDDPRWARRAAEALASSSGADIARVQATLQELRKCQEAVSEQLGETREAVLWLQRLEVVEQQMILIPDYQVKARKLAHDMKNVEERLLKAKKRAEKLIGHELPSVPEDDE